MIHTIAKTHCIKWTEAEQYTRLQYYKILLFENIDIENSKTE